MLAGWSLGRLVELWAQKGPRKEFFFTLKGSELQEMFPETSELELILKGPKNPGRGVWPGWEPELCLH